MFTGLFFHKFINELHFTNVAKRSETSLLGSVGLGHKECAGTERGMNIQSEVTGRLNTNAKDLLLDAISKANITKQQTEKHLHKE